MKNSFIQYFLTKINNTYLAAAPFIFKGPKDTGTTI